MRVVISKPKALTGSVSKPLAIIAHIQNRGDTASASNGWTGEPGGKLALEGFVIPDLPLAPGCGINYQVVLEDGSLSAPVLLGGYCGTRGKSKPIFGFCINLDPNAANSFLLTYEACFTDGTSKGPVEPGAICASESGRPVEAMRVWIAEIQTRRRSAVQFFRSLGLLSSSKPTAFAPIEPLLQEAKAQTSDQDDSLNPDLEQLAPRHNGAHFLAPTDLSVSPVTLRRVGLIGSCFLQAWQFPERHKNVCSFDTFIMAHAGTPPDPPSQGLTVSDYDFQIIQIPLRSILQDGVLWKIPYDDIDAHQEALDKAIRNLDFHLKSRMLWNTKYGLLTFVTNFVPPQKSLIGSLLPKFDIRNPEHVVHLLNEKLEALVKSYSNAYILDIDRISASYGRRFFQDDTVDQMNHASALGMTGPTTSRIEPMAAMSDHYETRPLHLISDAIWAEALLMYRTVRQTDAVKLVIMDLDDTLWAGVSGEMEDVSQVVNKAWVLGIAEALMFLKKRGILLAIASKNEEARIREIWPKIFGTRMSLSDFAAVQINWRPKAENIAQILSLLNLLPRSAVFVDDNPAERASVRQAFPEMRILGRYPYYLRRILLWSSETQVPVISSESSRRTEMVQAQIVREEKRGGMSREEFLSASAPVVTLFWITTIGDARLSRAAELINKTNQFNTTGKRWKHEEIEQFLTSGGKMLAFDVRDTFTEYGLVGVVMLRGSAIEQWVMSCRVLGYDIEQAVMSAVVIALRRSGQTSIQATLNHTETNFPCRDLFQKFGFAQEGPKWVLRSADNVSVPQHIKLLGSV